MSAARAHPTAIGDRPAWHALPADAALAALDATTAGLAEGERAVRRARFGPNVVGGRRRKRWLPELAESLVEPLQLLLLAVAVLSAVFGELRDAVAIAAVIVVVAVLETATEMRAARAIEALRAMSAPTARLRYGAGHATVPAAQLVPGDVVAVAAGDVVPADARVLAARGLRVDESTLTGEPAPVGKSEQPVAEATELADRTSMLYAGTAVLAGEGAAVVTATGAGSELGRLGRLVESAKEPPTPLQRTLSQLARTVLVIAIAASVLVPVVGLVAGQPWRQMILSGLTVAFATVPEELPILVVVLLAVGGRRLARRGALLRRLRAGETLGAVTTVVTDKTGTLTENRLELAGIAGDRATVLATALGTQPADDSSREPMERQLALAAAADGVPAPGEELAVFAFDPARKLVSRLHRAAAGTGGVPLLLSVAGAPEQVLARCVRTAAAGDLGTRAGTLAAQGFRVIAFATRALDAIPEERDDAERELTAVGLAWFRDPLRPGVGEAVARLSAAGVATIMVTGDHPDTAAAVAREVGLGSDTPIRGSDLDAMSDTELQTALAHTTVIARSEPATKHRVVAALQRQGQLVAVTGDGANDAPALAAADVGIALGHRGADLARAAADLVLTDDAYPTVVTAVAAGRNVGAQLRRAVAFYLGAKLALVLVLLIALAAGLPVVFEPIHIVLLEIFMDLGASVAFVAEPAAPGAMRRPPRPPGSRFLDRAELVTIATVAVTLVVVTLPGFLLLADDDLPAARATAVLGWLAGHALIAWTLRTRPGLSWRANPAFPAWAAAAIAVGALVTLTPVGAQLHLAVLGRADLAIPAMSVAVGLLAAIAARTDLRLRRTL